MLGEWYLVALLMGRMEAYNMGEGDKAKYECRAIVDAVDANKSVVLPARVAQLVALGEIEALTCLDEGTVRTLIEKRVMPSGPIELGSIARPKKNYTPRPTQQPYMPDNTSPIVIYRW